MFLEDVEIECWLALVKHFTFCKGFFMWFIKDLFNNSIILYKVTAIDLPTLLLTSSTWLWSPTSSNISIFVIMKKILAFFIKALVYCYISKTKFSHLFFWAIFFQSFIITGCITKSNVKNTISQNYPQLNCALSI